MSRYDVENYNSFVTANSFERQEIWGIKSNQRQLRSRLQLKLDMLHTLCLEKLSVIPEAHELLDHIARLQHLLKREPKLTHEQLENLLEHCKIYIEKIL